MLNVPSFTPKNRIFTPDEKEYLIDPAYQQPDQSIHALWDEGQDTWLRNDKTAALGDRVRNGHSGIGDASLKDTYFNLGQMLFAGSISPGKSLLTVRVFDWNCSALQSQIHATPTKCMYFRDVSKNG